MWIPRDKRFDEERENNRNVVSRMSRPNVLAPTEIDKWLIATVYEVEASVSCCKKCGAALGRDLTLGPPFRYPGISWSLSVTTRCKGRGRHRHVARVVDPGKDLCLSPFCRRRGR